LAISTSLRAATSGSRAGDLHEISQQWFLKRQNQFRARVANVANLVVDRPRFLAIHQGRAPEEVFGMPNVDEVWILALRFQNMTDYSRTVLM
jgi:hypothetical protein